MPTDRAKPIADMLEGLFAATGDRRPPTPVGFRSPAEEQAWSLAYAAAIVSGRPAPSEVADNAVTAFRTRVVQGRVEHDDF